MSLQHVSRSVKLVFKHKTSFFVILNVGFLVVFFLDLNLHKLSLFEIDFNYTSNTVPLEHTDSLVNLGWHIKQRPFRVRSGQGLSTKVDQFVFFKIARCRKTLPTL